MLRVAENIPEDKRTPEELARYTAEQNFTQRMVRIPNITAVGRYNAVLKMFEQIDVPENEVETVDIPSPDPESTLVMTLTVVPWTPSYVCIIRDSAGKWYSPVETFVVPDIKLFFEEGIVEFIGVSKLSEERIADYESAAERGL